MCSDWLVVKYGDSDSEEKPSVSNSLQCLMSTQRPAAAVGLLLGGLIKFSLAQHEVIVWTTGMPSQPNGQPQTSSPARNSAVTVTVNLITAFILILSIVYSDSLEPDTGKKNLHYH